eukprot:TRINITY_DN4912_c0_g1_i3.p1 TRINITY_DN4912_c0_g1~~TRINITY_DN4912_c0_g1_i3.p1  ORF type:complete len:321 (-),score=48.34 TRINITY_DN4912_c0_g1_i3:55-1017(-)
MQAVQKLGIALTTGILGFLIGTTIERRKLRVDLESSAVSRSIPDPEEKNEQSSAVSRSIQDPEEKKVQFSAISQSVSEPEVNTEESSTLITKPIENFYDEVEEQLLLKTTLNEKSRNILKYGVPDSIGEIYGFEDHVLSYSNIHRCPTWVAEKLSVQNEQQEREQEAHAVTRKLSRFRKDPNIHPYFAASADDYKNGPWSRGHMAAASNHKRSQKAMDDTFYLSNIVPQDKNNNVNYWYRMELFTRHLAKRRFDELTVFSGPLYLPNVVKGGRRYVKYEILGSKKKKGRIALKWLEVLPLECGQDYNTVAIDKIQRLQCY